MSAPSRSWWARSATASRCTRRNLLLDSGDYDRQRNGQAPDVVRPPRRPRVAGDYRDHQAGPPDLGARLRGGSSRVSEHDEQRTPAEAAEAAAEDEATAQATRVEGSARVADVHREVAETDVRRAEEEREQAEEQTEKLSRKERKAREKAEKAAAEALEERKKAHEAERQAHAAQRAAPQQP